MKKKEYEIPRMDKLEVELEKGFMKASVFDPEDRHDKGVTIDGHGFGNYQDFTGSSWDGEGTTF